MRVLRLPTIRSKHLETLVHTALSTAHAMTQNYDIVHYHTLGPALFSGFPRWFGKKDAGHGAGTGLATREMGAAGVFRATTRRAGVGGLAERDHGGVADFAPSATGRQHGVDSVLCAERGDVLRDRKREPRRDPRLGPRSGENTFCFSEGFRRRRDATCWWKPLSGSRPT
jgi:hypothetical protein